ncbi:hypothetical protein DIE08_25715 [Burkholderia sp. Bp9004]|nr:hypothetical protein F7R23_05240 [Burkholderia diffusa]RQZ63429.1 hypothetical protein DIE08_25715 [Burkholderia sp. Bp9004]
MERFEPASTGAAVRLLPGHQSVQCFGPDGKHRFLITKAGLLCRMKRCPIAAIRRTEGAKLLIEQQRISNAVSVGSSRCGISMRCDW